MTQVTRYELLQQSYKEVLDATKHQDDKVGRQLTALAFLTAATLVFASKGALSLRVNMNGSLEPLPTYFMSGFLLCTAVSALMLILALASPLFLPSSATRKRPEPDGPSSLFFKSMSQYSEDEWKRWWDESADRLPDVEEDLLEEVYNLARRADAKNARFIEGSTFFLYGIMFFALLVIGGLYSLSAGASLTTNAPTAGPPLKYTFLFRLLLGLVSGIFASIVIYDQLRRRQQTGDASFKRAEPFVGGNSVGIVPWCYATLLVLIVLNPHSGEWIWILSICAALAALVHLTAIICTTETQPIALVLPLMVGILLLGVAPLLFRDFSPKDRPFLQLWLSLGAASIPLIPSILASTRDRWMRQRKFRKRQLLAASSRHAEDY